LNFGETLEALGELSGQPAEAETWGLEDGAPVAFLVGTLRHMEHVPLNELPDELVAAIEEVDEVFFVGDANLGLRQSRFLRARRMPHTRGWIELTTKDAVIRIGPKRVPWLD
jgi:hypothetical protein